MKNIFSEIPESLPAELSEEIIHSEHCKIERIVSKAHSTPDDYWYDQDKNEWVIVLKGKAGLIFEGSDNIVIMKTGDYVNIPAHRKHRVEWTDPNQETIWLAVHY